jgi:HEAT repeat protein
VSRIFFISYNREDRDFAMELREQLQRDKDAQLLCYMDTDFQVGERWDEAIDRWIDASIGLIVIISANSMASFWVMYEWAFAMGQGKPVVPVLLQQADKIHSKLERLQWIDFSKPNKPWQELISVLVKLAAEGERPDIVNSAILALNDSSPERRAEGLNNLRHNTHPSATGALLNAIKSSQIDLAVRAGQALAWKTNYTDERAIDGLEKGFHTIFEEDATRDLAGFKTPRSRELLEQWLQSGTGYPGLVIWGLGQMGSPASVKLIVPFSDTKDEALFGIVTEALAAIGDASAMTALFELLETSQRRELSEEYHFLKIPGALGRAGDKALSGLLDRLNHPNASVRYGVAKALLIGNHKSALPKLQAALEYEQDPKVQQSLRDAIAFLEK